MLLDQTDLIDAVYIACGFWFGHIVELTELKVSGDGSGNKAKGDVKTIVVMICMLTNRTCVALKMLQRIVRWALFRQSSRQIEYPFKNVNLNLNCEK